MRIAAFDFGSNSLKSLSAELKGSKLHFLTSGRVLTRLGTNPRLLSAEAIKETIAGASHLLAEIQKQGKPDLILAVGTEALRQAENTAELVSMLQAATGIDLKVISSREEAELVWSGATYGRSFTDVELVLFDSGGASTEICRGKGVALSESVSYPWGAVNLTAAYIHRDLPQQDEIEELSRFLQKLLHPSILCPAKLLGTGGGIQACAKVAIADTRGEDNTLDGFRLHRKELERQSRLYLSTPLELRKLIPGMEKDRADIIPAACLLYLQLMQAIGIDSVEICTRGLRHGLIVRYLQENAAQIPEA